MQLWRSLIIFLLPLVALAQQTAVSGTILDETGLPLPLAHVTVIGQQAGTTTDLEGNYLLESLPPGTHTLRVTAMGYRPGISEFRLQPGETARLDLHLEPAVEQLSETVVTGTMKAVNRTDTPVPVEVYSPTFFKRNPTANIFEGLQNVNGVRPQINCNVCNTGDIHINGLEGPYTLVLIDGMPIVSGLGTVYGLSGIPNSLIEQVEIVKGPASSLYGSEAVGGLINVITKAPLGAPEFFSDGFVTGWGEYNLDAGGKIRVSPKSDLLLGVNYFNYDVPIDNNGDNFTDVTLQERISIFQKWQVKRPQNRVLQWAGRFFYEDRWGGEMQWTPANRGGDQVYGESIYTRRWEVLARYQLPTEEPLMLAVSYNDHDQNSVYGDTPYLAQQRIGFGQLTWDKTAGRHDLLAGLALRYTYYDDNTPATANGGENNPDQVWLPGIFVQDEWKFSPRHSLLSGLRYDYDRRHGSVVTPRVAYRWKTSEFGVLRLNAGTGFRVVNLFTEDHAALTGARDVIIEEDLQPERSWNANLNYLQKFYTRSGHFFALDASAFYTRFTNAIIPDYDSNPDEIRYRNLDGKAVSMGLSANLEMAHASGLRVSLGATLQDVSNTQNGQRQRQILTENFMGTWSVGYEIRALRLAVDYTGNLYGPMRLPLLGELDPRREFSPVWSLQNIQLTYKGLGGFQLYGGVKNLLDWTPNRGNPFIIARASDPFDRNVTFNASGDPVATPDNPYALTFDPSYVYGPNQGIRAFIGLRYQVD
ncbi:TonB-dependent receptor [Robiginitalea sediminis]|uniref:TonB-dependent receptor n=1 Tax=Robiginitalea sediminis TaxID=1982593 RepID=UPI000B4A6ABE|nr:TonB-dependent receptor [Robiginitalea sediminis]